MTTVAVGLLPVYFAEIVVGPSGVLIGNTRYSATSLWGFVVGAAAFLSFLFAPVLGATSDFSATKKRFLLTLAYQGSFFTLLLYFCHSGDVYKTLFFFLMAQVGFIGANVFYDSFLPQIASGDRIDWVSGKGYAYGYIGGGIQFVLALLLLVGHEQLDLSQSQAVRFAIVLAGLWWAGFTLFTVKYLSEAPSTETLPCNYRSWPRLIAYLAIGVSRTLRTIQQVGHFRHLSLFLIGFILYNDGIQTVINMATIYGKEELQLEANTLMVTLGIIQAVATLGALLFSRLAGYIGTKRTIMVTLVFWSGVVTYAYFIQTAREYFSLGVIVGIVLGGSQSLSRSFYGSMIPEEASAEFYGFYTVFSKFSAIWGPWIFALSNQMMSSVRLAIVSLIAFFIAGLVLLFFVDEEKAREIKLTGAF